ncbi:ATP-binding cassette domain-containing protein [Thermomonas brevis]|uniref:ATP-binding cassette domain-containing protein n=1 Tax=Thermomonas brevis TaxID=215691 RepID=A0A7G9QT90_9GAMM|nr:ATP-binding cassette domain-containing protein [Thermomonas brevis]QNN46565.1 ATP-binding cassette domain-containing protein [Thermomonas brevis]
MLCLQTRRLTHRFREGTALAGIDLEVPAGSIYGFLGPNGAGKTTTLRLLLGLLAPQAGEILVFGRPLTPANRPEAMRRIGAMIESPAFYGNLTARENLLLLQRIHRCPAARVDEVLALVGLADTQGKRAARFSLGMKQRLGLAMALLHGPDLMILDEPTNGLDPGGIVEMRQLLQRLNRERGITFLVSSHLLAEVEKFATHVGILDRGRLLFQGSIADLQARRREAGMVRLRTDDDARAEAWLRQAGHAARRGEGGLALPMLDDPAVAAAVAGLVGAGIGIHGVASGQDRADLEDIFMDMTEGGARREAA